MEEDDVVEAEKRYSQFAVEILSVENAAGTGRLDDVIVAFIGRPAELTRTEVHHCILGGGVMAHNVDATVDNLCGLSFLGLEVRPGEFAFAEDPVERRRLQAMARRVTEESGAE